MVSVLIAVSISYARRNIDIAGSRIDEENLAGEIKGQTLFA
jgi:hypothetical protein